MARAKRNNPGRKRKGMARPAKFTRNEPPLAVRDVESREVIRQRGLQILDPGGQKDTDVLPGRMSGRGSQLEEGGSWKWGHRSCGHAYIAGINDSKNDS